MGFDLNNEYQKITAEYQRSLKGLLDRAIKEGTNGVALGISATPAIVPPPKTTVTRKDRRPAPKVRTKAKASTKKERAAKRTIEELKALQDKLVAYIGAHPGEGIEAISKGIGEPSKDLVLPMKQLRAAKAITTKGNKRSTTYFAKGAKKEAE